MGKRSNSSLKLKSLAILAKWGFLDLGPLINLHLVFICFRSGAGAYLLKLRVHTQGFARERLFGLSTEAQRTRLSD